MCAQAETKALRTTASSSEEPTVANGMDRWRARYSHGGRRVFSINLLRLSTCNSEGGGRRVPGVAH